MFVQFCFVILPCIAVIIVFVIVCIVFIFFSKQNVAVVIVIVFIYFKTKFYCIFSLNSIMSMEQVKVQSSKVTQNKYETCTP